MLKGKFSVTVNRQSNCTINIKYESLMKDGLMAVCSKLCCLFVSKFLTDVLTRVTLRPRDWLFSMELMKHLHAYIC